MYVVSFCVGDTLTTNNNPFGIMSCKLSFILDRLIICKPVQYIG